MSLSYIKTNSIIPLHHEDVMMHARNIKKFLTQTYNFKLLNYIKNYYMIKRYYGVLNIFIHNETIGLIIST
jgi:hypothetical protein